MQLFAGREALVLIQAHQDECNRSNTELRRELREMRTDLIARIENVAGQVTAIQNNENSAHKALDDRITTQAGLTDTTYNKIINGAFYAMAALVAYLAIHGPPWSPLVK
jgi:hypothetical protein